MLELETLLQPVAGDTLCGPDIRFDPAFREVEDAPARFKDMTPDELRAVVRSCADLLARSKDQLPAIIALQAATRLGDLDDMVAALTLLREMISEHWDEYHPGPADEMQVARSNELSALSRPPALLVPLERLRILRLPPPLGTEINSAMLEQACRPTAKWGDADEDQLKSQVESGAITQVAARAQRSIRENGRQLRMIMRCLSEDARAADLLAGVDDADGAVDQNTLSLAVALRAEVEIVRSKLASSSDLFYDIAEQFERRNAEVPTFGPVLSRLRSMIEACDKFLSQFPEPNGSEASPQQSENSDVVLSDQRTDSGQQKFVPGDLRSRRDVLEAIDAICRYYAEVEPGSPVPVMLRRVRKWVQLDFIALMQEILPGNMDEVRRLMAVSEEAD